MFTRSLLLLLIIGTACSVAKTAEKEIKSDDHPEERVKISGWIHSTSSYCGGAAPDQKTLDLYHTPRPYTGWLYLREGRSNTNDGLIADSIRPDQNGFFSFDVKKGNYVLIYDLQKNDSILDKLSALESEYISVDKPCLKGWFANGLLKISAEDSLMDSLVFNFHQRCFVPYAIPCISYNGPYPP